MQDLTEYTLPFGKNKGEPIAALETPRLLWLMSRDYIRYKHPEFTRAGLALLTQRMGDMDKLMVELTPLAPPPARWKKEEKRLRAMVEPIRKQVMAARAQRDGERGQILNAADFVREARKAASRPDPLAERIPDANDVSDLL